MTTAPTNFPDLPLNSHVAAALARRGYETATPVQAAVVAPELAGRDLLVSAQTGSGKTVAFGTLIADTLLAPAGEAERRRARPPRALVVAPTRELAQQVARELEWLLEGGKLRIVAVTGGTSVQGDLRALHAGVDVVVGTPGRLVDLNERKALDLTALTVLVLDEADEMLDLGFKEDLEYLLGHAPKERRTLLFSATIPKDIARLAATYQRDAVRVDARAPDAKHGHADITYAAHLVRMDDRFAAVVNVLLAAGEAKAIVFVRTREGVSGLTQRLLDHGFKVVSMAGDRAQGERDRALEALRSGSARILVATNVAARGLDLPDVELVLHADLPDSADSLTHRSGRTGRAGKKGRSVVIAEERARRKAERLFSEARLPVAWSPPPSDADVRQALQERLINDILEEARTAPGEEVKDPEAIVGVADRLRAALPDRVLVSLLLAREVERLPRAMRVHRVETEWRRPSDGDRRPPRPGDRGAAPPVIFRVNLGAAAKADPGWLLPLICRRGAVTRHAVGAIRVGAQESTFEISGELAADFARAAAVPDPRAPDVRIQSVTTGPRTEPHKKAAFRPQESTTPHAPRATLAPRGPHAAPANRPPHAPRGPHAAPTPRAARGPHAAPPTKQPRAEREEQTAATPHEPRAPRDEQTAAPHTPRASREPHAAPAAKGPRAHREPHAASTPRAPREPHAAPAPHAPRAPVESRHRKPPVPREILISRAPRVPRGPHVPRGAASGSGSGGNRPYKAKPARKTREP